MEISCPPPQGSFISILGGGPGKRRHIGYGVLHRGYPPNLLFLLVCLVHTVPPSGFLASDTSQTYILVYRLISAITRPAPADLNGFSQPGAQPRKCKNSVRPISPQGRLSARPAPPRASHVTSTRNKSVSGHQQALRVSLHLLRRPRHRGVPANNARFCRNIREK